MIRVNLHQSEKPETPVHRGMSVWTPAVVLLILCVLVVFIMLAIYVIRSIQEPHERNVDIQEAGATLSLTWKGRPEGHWQEGTGLRLEGNFLPWVPQLCEGNR